MPSAVVDYTIQTSLAASPQRMKKQRAARVDVTLRLGSGPVAEGLDEDEVAIASMAGWLGLSATVVERAKKVFRKVEEARAWQGYRGWTKLRSKELVYAACLSIACRNEGSLRSLKELVSAIDEVGAAARLQIARLTKHIRGRLGEEVAGRTTGVGLVRASSYLRRFRQVLGMGDEEVVAAKEAVRRLEESDLEVRHTGESIAAAVVCLALEHADADRRNVLRDVAAATGVSTVTINNVCKKLRTHAELLFG
ncbi:unnamed protein product [Alopecurus aequalis]